MIHPGHFLLPAIPTGTLDPDWMPKVAAMNLVVIAGDRHIRTKPAELHAFRDHGLRVFWIAGKRDLTSWGKLLRLVARWDDIERTIAARGLGLWFMAINEFDLTEIPVP
jgi:hypothetical protein